MTEVTQSKQRLKHGGGRKHLGWEDVGTLAEEQPGDLVDLNEALDRLAAEDPTKAELVKLRFFAGLTMPEIAQLMNVSLATAEHHWTYARTWLYAELADRDHSGSS